MDAVGDRFRSRTPGGKIPLPSVHSASRSRSDAGSNPSYLSTHSSTPQGSESVPLLATGSQRLFGDVGSQLELRQIRNYNAGAVVKELIGMRADTDTDDEAEATLVASLDAGQGIFHHRRSGRSDVEVVAPQ